MQYLLQILHLSCQVHRYVPHESGLMRKYLRVLFIYMENQKFPSENQIVHAIPFGKLQKIWALIWGESTFQLFLASCSADVDILCGGSFSYSSNFIVLCLCTRFPPGWFFVNGIIKSTPNLHCSVLYGLYLKLYLDLKRLKVPFVCSPP